jgi:hypothetical protein
MEFKVESTQGDKEHTSSLVTSIKVAITDSTNNLEGMAKQKYKF